MKRVIVFLTVYLLTLTAFGQDNEIKLSLTKSSLQDIFTSIEDQSDYTFLYFHKDVKNVEIDFIDIVEKDISKILTLLLKNTGLKFQINGKVVVINKVSDRKKQLQIIRKFLVKGTITDEVGNPLPGVTIVEKGTRIGIITDINGKYEFPVTQHNIITFSFVGKRKQEITVNSDTTLNVVMKDIIFDIEEVFVTGYETEKKKNVSGSIVHINSDEIQQSPTESFEKTIQGRVAGVRFTPNTGSPGSSVSINIRGLGSINANNSPLFIIDGVQINSSESNSIIPSSNALAGLNHDDIESIDILKDGATASIYGAQAANGVIIITTKKGKSGKVRINAKISTGVSEIVRKLDLLSGPQWAELTLLNYKNRYGENSNDYQTLLASYISNGWGEDGFSNAPTTDWQDAVFRTGVTQKYSVSASGGNPSSRYYISTEYQDIEGVVINTDFKKYSFRLNHSSQLSKRVYASSNISFSSFKQNGALDGSSFANPNRSATLIVPTNPIYNPDGTYFTDLIGTYKHNVVMTSDLNVLKATTNRLTSRITFKVNILDNLAFKSLFAYDYMEILEKYFFDPRTLDGAPVNGRVGVSNIRETNFQTDQLLVFNKDFDDSHRVNAILGFSFRKNVIKTNDAEGTGVSTPDFKLLSQTARPEDVNETFNEWKIAGLFSKVKYAYKDRYILNATVRYDGSSRFGDDRQFGLFPAISGAWRISSEKFMEDIDYVDDLKLRASYGVTGNSNIGNYVNMQRFLGNGDYLEKPGLEPDPEVGNNKIRWEENHTINIGLDISVLDRRVNIETDIFKRTTKNLLLARELPSTTGHEFIWENSGEVVNKGIELVVETKNIKTKNITWLTSFNIAFNHNEITSLQEGVDRIGDIHKVGEPIGAAYTYRYAGVDPDNGRPMWYDKNDNTTYQPRADDRVWIESFLPKIYGGFINDIKLGQFTFSAVFDFQAGAKILNTNKFFLARGGSTGDRNQLQVNYNDYWKQPGDKTWIPKPVYGGVYDGEATRKFYSKSTLLYEKTDFIKLRTLSLQYMLPKELSYKINADKIVFFINGYNLWTTSPYTGFDPEFTDQDNGVYPPSRTITAGINLSF